MDNTGVNNTPVKKVLRPVQKQAKGLPIERPIGNIITSQLHPFGNTMRLQLRRAGYNTESLPLKSVIPLYYNVFVARGELKETNYFEFINNPVFKIRPSDNLNGEISDVHKDYFRNVNEIVYNIIQKFKLSQSKRNYVVSQGMNYMEVLTDEEIVQAKATDKIIKDLKAKELGSTVVTVNDMKNILLIGLFLYLLFEIMRGL